MSNLKAKLHKENGFTLIEMLIVVAIIAILIAIAIPLVNKALERAREATDEANERAALGLAMVEVLSDNTLGTTAPGTDGKVYAFYEVQNSKGSFATGTTGTKPTSYGSGGKGGYGKGTALAPNTTKICEGKTILITYDSKASDEADQFVVDWVE